MARTKITAQNYVPSLIRTYTPIGVGLVAGWLATRGLHLDPPAQAAVTAVATAVISAAYYAAVRALEVKFPALGLLLGKRAQPVYVKPAAPVAPADDHKNPPQVGPFRPA